MHFGPGAEIIGGEIDIARIDRDEGFVWVQQQSLPVSETRPTLCNYRGCSYELNSVRRTAPLER